MWMIPSYLKRLAEEMRTGTTDEDEKRAESYKLANQQPRPCAGALFFRLIFDKYLYTAAFLPGVDPPGF